jgi:hypothetical protein
MIGCFLTKRVKRKQDAHQNEEPDKVPKKAFDASCGRKDDLFPDAAGWCRTWSHGIVHGKLLGGSDKENKL